LAEVHRAGFMHRDIKPGNILLNAKGVPVLVDFGSARQEIGGRSRSITSVVTPGYAPIEQYSSRGNQGPWTDIYALGAVAYRAITGEAPPDATERVRKDPMTPATDAARGKYSAKFLAAVDWALAVDEDKRPQDVDAWREVLTDESRAQKPAVAAPPAKPEVKPEIKRNVEAKESSGMGWVVVIFGVFVVGGLLAEWQGHRQQESAIAKLTPKCNEPVENGDPPCWHEMTNRPGCYFWNLSPELGETFEWSGQCRNGVQDGLGEEIRRTDGREAITKKTGSFVDGKRHGDWVERWANGTVLEGPYVDGKRHGDWVWRFADGGVWEGPYVDGKMHGDWVERFADGSVWEGPYRDGERHGDWVEQFASGAVFEGPYVDGKQHGDWVERWADGDVYEGPYVDGKKRGDWVERYADGDVYEGPYVDGERHGHWVVRRADGGVLEGPYVDGKRHGDWVARFAHGDVYEGPYVDGKRHGDWVERYANGDEREIPSPRMAILLIRRCCI